MPTVKFTSALSRFFPGLQDTFLPDTSLPALLQTIEKSHPGIQSYIVNERGSLRKHVNIFVDGELIQDRKHLSDKVMEGSEVYIMQALSGG